MQDGSWDNYRFVLAIYRHVTLSAAAVSLGVNETTVSRRLLQAENRLNTKLFLRKQKGLVPTDAGMSLVQRIERAEMEISSAEDEVSGSDRLVAGAVRIVAGSNVINILLVPHIKTLLNEHINLKLDLIATDDVGDRALHDADIVIHDCKPCDDSRLVLRSLGKLVYGVYAAREAMQEGKRRPALPRITLENRKRDFQSGSPTSINPQVADSDIARIRVNNSATLLECVRAGLGTGLIPEAFVTDEVEFQSQPTDEDGKTCEFWLTYKSEIRDLQRMRVTVQWVTDCINKVTFE